MTILGRRNSTAPSSSRREAARKEKLRRIREQRRTLLAEPLEARAMMDGDGFPSLVRYPFWNIAQPRDVNADGRVTAMDALSIVNELNLRGARSLDTSGASAGENGESRSNFIDVNNDNRVSAMDALQVINQLNSAGEGPPMIRYTVDIVAEGTNDPISAINKGGFYEMRVLVEDLGLLSYMTQTRPATLPANHPTHPNETALGVFTSFFDVLYNTSATDVQLNESQRISMTGTTSPGGTFTLTVNDNGTFKTTGNIVFQANNSAGRLQTAKNIQDALNATGVLGADSVEVVSDSSSQNQWRVRFLNRLSNKDIPEMTATPGNGSGGTVNLGAGVAINVTELNNGLVGNTLAYSDALLPRVVTDAANFPINTPLFYVNQRGGSRMATGINDVGGTGSISPPFPGTDQAEILRVRMNALDAGIVNYNVSIANVLSGLETGVNGFTIPITADLIEVVTDTLTITEALSAGNDSPPAILEGSTAPIDIVVTTNDVNNSPTPNTPKVITGLDLTGTLGTAIILNPTTIRYTPPGGDVSGTDTFKYTVRDTPASGTPNTDIGTVTITINPVNDAPNVNGPVSQTFNEDTSRTFNAVNGNAITITDVDAASGLLTMTLNVGAGNGTLQLGDTTGLVGLTGNNTSSITTQGTLTELNEALQNLTYTPVANANGTVTLAINVNDNGNTGGAAQQGSRNITLNVTAVNDAPVVDLTGFTASPAVIEGDPLVLNSATNTRIAVSDPDSGANPVQVTLHVSTGNTINVPAAAGVTLGTNNTNNVTLTGTVTAVSAALNGITYTAALGFGGSNESLQITINDQGNTGGGALSDSKTVTIIVDPAVRPSARRDQLSVNEDSTAGASNTVDVLANDLVNLVPAGTVARLISFQATSVHGGTITLDPGLTGADTDDKLIYVPAPNYFGADSFTYVMNDTSGAGANATGTVDVTVREVNDPVTAVDDTLTSIAEDAAAVTIPAASLTGNDSAGPLETTQTLTITAVSNPVGGTVTLVAGNPVFTPALNYNGPASFDYVVTDNGTTNGVAAPLSDTGSVTFTITEVNDVPTAGNQTLASVAEDTASVTIPFATLLAGATTGPANENTQTLTVSAVSAPVGGTVNIVGTDVIFTPTANFNGNASFTFTVTDNGTTNGASDPKSVNATASFTITPVNDAPTGVADALTISEGQVIDIPVQANDFDVDQPPFTGVPPTVTPGTTVSIVTPPDPVLQGTATVNANGTIKFTPVAGFFGDATFTYQLDDHSGAANNLSAPVLVTVTVVELNDPPVAVNDTATTSEDPATPLAIDILANDSDPDTAKANWTVTIVTPPLHGTAVFNTTTRVVDYSPAANYNGPDTFVYKVNDQSTIAPLNLDSGNATVSITITEVNDTPVANNDPASGTFTVIKDRDRTFTAAQLLANDSPGVPANESSQTITVTSVSATSAHGGTVTLVGGVVTYTPLAGYIGPDSFTYTITDNGLTNGAADPKTATATVNITVVDFIPTDVNGFVFRDVNNNGTYQVGIDYPLSGVAVTLSGTSDITGAIAPITVETNHLGFYEFLAVEPGDYHVRESQPVALADGPETTGQAAAFFANDDILLDLPLLGLNGGVSTNNFAEGAIDANQLVNAAGLVSESLSSSSANGYVLATTLGGSDIWSWALQGWTNATSIQITLDADLSAATLVVNGFSTRIFQNPYDTRNANRLNPDSTARLARFRILGWDASGNYIIRLDGAAAHFYGSGHPLAAAAPASAGEMSAGEYVEGVDAAMGEEAWA